MMKIDYVELPNVLGKWDSGYLKQDVEFDLELGVPRVISNGNAEYINYNDCDEIHKKIKKYLDHDSQPIVDNDSLLFLEDVDFPRRKLKNIALYSKVKDLKPVRKKENATKIIANKIDIQNKLKQYSKVDTRYRYYWAQKLVVKLKSGLYLANPVRDNKLNGVISRVDYETNKLTKLELIKLFATTKQKSIDLDDEFIEAEMFIITEDYLGKDIKTLVSCFNDNSALTDISELYKVIGSKVMDYQEYKRLEDQIDRITTSNSDDVFKMIAENLPSYDIDKSIFYMCLLFKDYFQSRGYLMNTNVRSLYKFCQDVSKFNYSTTPVIMANLDKAGYKMNVPLTFLLSNQSIDNTKDYFKSSLANMGLEAEINVSIAKNIIQHIYLDVDIDDFNKKLNK